MVSSLLARCIIVTIGTLYPGYRSYKSLITGDARQVVHWLRYWILFSIFIACETITDVFLSWFPFYYWIKIFLVLWMISPSGSTLLYKRFVRPVLKEREQEIDELLEQTKQKGYSTLLELTSKSFRYASNVFLNTAVLGQTYLGEHLKRSLSASDIVNSSIKGSFKPADPLMEQSEEDDEEIDLKVNKRMKQGQNHSTKPSNGASRQLRSNQREKTDSSVDDQLDEFKPSTITTRKQRTTNKTSSTIYSSNESSHYGTISKRQMVKMPSSTTKKSTMVIPSFEHESAEIDDQSANQQST